ncbi:MAG: hypothetical protein Q9164_003618 [Protoblastenia rupestris]
MGTPNHTALDNLSRRGKGDSANPFVAFRHFADEQLSSILNLAFGSNNVSNNSPTPSQLLTHDYDPWLEGIPDSRDQLEREAEETAQVMYLYMRTLNDASNMDNKDLCEQSTNKDEHMRCPYRNVQPEQLSLQDIHDIYPFLRRKTPSPLLRQRHTDLHLYPDLLLSQILTSPSPRPAVPLSYLLNNKYSPIDLEFIKPFNDHDLVWRAAFEDLLSMQNDQGLLKDTRNTSPSPETSFQWIKNMVIPAIRKSKPQTEKEADEVLEGRAKITTSHQSADQKGDRIQNGPEQYIMDGLTNLLLTIGLEGAFAKAKCKQTMAVNAEIHEDEDGELDDSAGANELNLYGHLLRKQSSSSPDTFASGSRTLDHPQYHSSPDGTFDNHKPTVLSTLTTTEKRVLQDGTTRTKVVLKKRFSDGREESTETVHTHNALLEKSKRSSLESIAKQDREHDGDKGKRGWFWT